MQKIIEIKNGIARQQQYRFKEPVNLDIYDEPIAIVGPNGSGKSILVDILTGKHPLQIVRPLYDFTPSQSEKACDNIRLITFCDTYGDSSSISYYQQRWNHGVEAEVESESPTVRSLLESNVENSPTTNSWWNELCKILHLDDLFDKYVYMLSSGELRRFQLALALRTMPRVLIVDNPFIGLDASIRSQVSDMLHRICDLQGVLLILVVSRVDDVPEYIRKVIAMNAMSCEGIFEGNDYKETRTLDNVAIYLPETMQKAIRERAYLQTVASSKEVIRCNHINIRYGERTVLKNLDWTVQQGEKWALCGKNGAGKSTLLSLIYADNPQAYACDISLFGNRRGTGESIWDIKKRIGYVSPEMYRSYRKNINTIEIVASGLHDSIGLYCRSSVSEQQCCKWWMNIFGIEHLAERPYLSLSSGEQRMVLLVRAFVKDPELLILDEPFHGLDDQNKERAREIIEVFCSRPAKTLIMVSHYEEDFPSCMDHRLTLYKNE